MKDHFEGGSRETPTAEELGLEPWPSLASGGYDPLLLLELRNAMMDKKWLIVCAETDLAKYGEWRCNWEEAIQEASVEVRRVMKLLRS